MKEISEIIVILNKLKNILNDIINSLDAVFLDKLVSINKELRNLSKSGSSLIILLEKKFLDKNIIKSSL